MHIIQTNYEYMTVGGKKGGKLRIAFCCFVSRYMAVHYSTLCRDEIILGLNNRKNQDADKTQVWPFSMGWHSN